MVARGQFTSSKAWWIRSVNSGTNDAMNRVSLVVLSYNFRVRGKVYLHSNPIIMKAKEKTSVWMMPPFIPIVSNHSPNI